MLDGLFHHVHSLKLLRIGVAVCFMAHATVRVFLNTVPGFGAFLASKGFPFAVACVWAITLYELIAGSLLLLGIAVRAVIPGFLGIVTSGIILIHWQFGWFVGEHGTGGVEYSFMLILALLTLWTAYAPQAQLEPRLGV
jgi:putative oxidoreductase